MEVESRVRSARLSAAMETSEKRLASYGRGWISGSGEATCGGQIRDHKGNWITAFISKLGLLPSTSAELMSILHIMKICREKGFRKVAINSDSVEALTLINKECSRSHPLISTIDQIR